MVSTDDVAGQGAVSVSNSSGLANKFNGAKIHKLRATKNKKYNHYGTLLGLRGKIPLIKRIAAPRPASDRLVANWQHVESTAVKMVCAAVARDHAVHRVG